MRHKYTILITLFSVLTHSSVFAQTQVSTPRINSHRIAKLWSDIQAGDQAALPKFWEEAKGKMPMWEWIFPPRGNNGFLWATYLWHGDDKTVGVTLRGGVANEMSGSTGALERLPGTDVWYLSEYTPSDSRIGYNFEVTRRNAQGELEHKEEMDALNPHSFLGESVLEMPSAPAQPWVTRQPGVPEGQVTPQTIYSDILNQQREFSVYTPANYRTSTELANLLVLFDGQSYISGIPAPVILDNLITKGKIAPTVAVLIRSNNVDSQNRNTRTADLTCSKPFADFVVKELVPWVKTHYRVSPDPRRAAIGGHSLGGLQATYVGFTYPNIFGNVLSESGSYFYFQGWPFIEKTFTTQTGWLTQQFATTPKKPLRLYLETGTLEGDGVAEVRRMRDVLIARGYAPTYYEFNGGHDQLCWRASFGEALIALLGKQHVGPVG